MERYDALKLMEYNAGFEIGHFYSPIPNLDEIKERQDKIFNDDDLLDIDLNEAKQWELLNELQKYYSLYPYKSEHPNDQQKRYQPGKDVFYRFSDAVFLFCMLMHIKPNKIIEVGSGHSSAIMLDTNETFLENSMHCTFIDPNPEHRLHSIMKAEDEKKHRFLNEKVQDINTDLFRELSDSDILFIDSTHVSKVGSDVNHLLFKIFPILQPGVIIHIHDIFYPFEYPREWIFKGKMFWNENYILRAFLMNNPGYKILLFNTYLQKQFKPWFESNMP